jgi:hypothetical protein
MTSIEKHKKNRPCEAVIFLDSGIQIICFPFYLLRLVKFHLHHQR